MGGGRGLAFISRTGCLVRGRGRGFLKINLSGCFVVFSDKMALQPRTIKALVILVAGETAVSGFIVAQGAPS